MTSLLIAQTLNGDKFTLSLDFSKALVSSVKAELAELMGLDCSKDVSIIYVGKSLNDDHKTLQECNIANESVIHVVHRQNKTTPISSETLYSRILSVVKASEFQTADFIRSTLNKIESELELSNKCVEADELESNVESLREEASQIRKEAKTQAKQKKFSEAKQLRSKASEIETRADELQEQADEVRESVEQRVDTATQQKKELLSPLELEPQRVARVAELEQVRDAAIEAEKYERAEELTETIDLYEKIRFRLLNLGIYRWQEAKQQEYARNAEIRELKTKIENLQAEIQHLKDRQVVELEAKLVEQSEQFQKNKTTLNQLQAQLNKKSQELADANAEIILLQAAESKVQSENSQLQSHNSQLQSQNSELQAQLTDSKLQICQLQSEKSELQTKFNSVERQLKGFLKFQKISAGNTYS